MCRLIRVGKKSKKLATMVDKFGGGGKDLGQSVRDPPSMNSATLWLQNLEKWLKETLVSYEGPGDATTQG